MQTDRIVFGTNSAQVLTGDISKLINAHSPVDRQKFFDPSATIHFRVEASRLGSEEANRDTH